MAPLSTSLLPMPSSKERASARDCLTLAGSFPILSGHRSLPYPSILVSSSMSIRPKLNTPFQENTPSAAPLHVFDTSLAISREDKGRNFSMRPVISSGIVVAGRAASITLPAAKPKLEGDLVGRLPASKLTFMLLKEWERLPGELDDSALEVRPFDFPPPFSFFECLGMDTPPDRGGLALPRKSAMEGPGADPTGTRLSASPLSPSPCQSTSSPSPGCSLLYLPKTPSSSSSDESPLKAGS
mmetsp:Transcript_30830/g.80771  ORF Transcript_30830/g.80771 Transcript_30830/m.80771 type:complete len:241 (+) Transcript_30830:2088-2810(+)